jgi:hypothetical protein
MELEVTVEEIVLATRLESPGLAEGIWRDWIRRPGIAASKLTGHLWCEAVDVGDPDWPPSWLYRAGTVIAFIVVVYFGSSTITDLLANAGASARSSNWGLVIEAPIRAYFEQHSAGLPVSTQKLIHVWGLAGLILFIVSLFGNIGARVGWVVFGLFSLVPLFMQEPSHRPNGLPPESLHLHGLAFPFLLSIQSIDGECVKSGADRVKSPKLTSTMRRYGKTRIGTPSDRGTKT